MNDKNLYLLAEFDGETQKILSDYYEILKNHGFIGNQTKDIPYHFTLGNMDCGCEEFLIEKMEKVCGSTQIFEIKLDHLGLFGLDVLFVEPNMNFELLSLQKFFFENCGNGDHPWTAHATVLVDEYTNILRALPILAENFKPIHAKIVSISLFEFFPKRFIKCCNLL